MLWSAYVGWRINCNACVVCGRCLAGITARILVIQSKVFCDLLVPAAKCFHILKLRYLGLSELLTASLDTLQTYSNWIKLSFWKSYCTYTCVVCTKMGFILLHCVPYKIPSLDTILNEFHPGCTVFLLTSILILSTSSLRCAFHQVFLLKF
jgi:hypothetical protein